MKGLPKSIIKKYGVTKKAWRVFKARKGKRSPGKTRRASNPKKRRVRRTVRRRRGRRRYSMTIPLSIVVPLIAGLSTPAEKLIRGDIKGAGEAAVRRVAMVEPSSGQFNMGYFWLFWGPLLIGCGLHKVAGMLGVNRALGRARVPFIRI